MYAKGAHIYGHVKVPTDTVNLISGPVLYSCVNLCVYVCVCVCVRVYM